MPTALKRLVEGGSSQPQHLPEDPWRYFNKVPGAILVPLSSLRPTRARPDGIANANRLMRRAYDGKGKKRDPISLRQEPDGMYVILDGNSTYANAVAYNWLEIPALVDGL